MPVDTSREAESVRLFKSDFLEFFTHISPITVLVMWVPIVLLLLVYAILNSPVAGFPWHIPLGLAVGLLLWTAAEYNLHRFLFHYEPSTPRQERIFYLFHGVHHAYPQDKTRRGMPLAVSIPLAILFYGLFYLVFATILQAGHWVNPVMVGFMIGYLIYDMIHYATHHFPMRWGVFKYLKRHHMLHHYKTPDARFGVSSPLWDIVYGTLPKDA